MSKNFAYRNNIEHTIFIHCKELIKKGRLLCKQILNRNSFSVYIFEKYVDEYCRLGLSAIFEPLLESDLFRDPLTNTIQPILYFFNYVFLIVNKIEELSNIHN
jgi:hypothetical protein